MDFVRSDFITNVPSGDLRFSTDISCIQNETTSKEIHTLGGSILITTCGCSPRWLYDRNLTSETTLTNETQNEIVILMAKFAV